MLSKSIIPFLLFFSLLISCKSEYEFIINSPREIQVNQELQLSVTEKNDRPIDSIIYSINTKKIKGNKFSATANINDFKLGKHSLEALVFYENKSKKVTKPIYIMADVGPEIYTYKIINTYPHDKEAYTQGLEFHDGYLYESTGQKGKSTVRKVELETGKVIKKIDLDSDYFGEGITIFKGKIYHLTWKAGVGFVYNLETLEKERDFKYTKSLEGWGLCNDGNKLIKSEGTERIWFLNEDTQLEENYIEAYTDSQKVEELNELEYINGKIYANRWHLNSILIINPKSGKVEGVADLNSLKDIVQQNVKLLNEKEDVLNGIAYDKENDRLFVTGKHWSKLYEIELIKK
jgi:glutamine cyclotransferase